MVGHRTLPRLQTSGLVPSSHALEDGRGGPWTAAKRAARSCSTDTTTHTRSWSTSLSDSARPLLQAGLGELYDLFHPPSPAARPPLLPTVSPTATATATATGADDDGRQERRCEGQPTLRQYHSISSARTASTQLQTALRLGPTPLADDPYAYGLTRSRSTNDRSRLTGPRGRKWLTTQGNAHAHSPPPSPLYSSAPASSSSPSASASWGLDAFERRAAIVAHAVPSNATRSIIRGGTGAERDGTLSAAAASTITPTTPTMHAVSSASAMGPDTDNDDDVNARDTEWDDERKSRPRRRSPLRMLRTTKPWSRPSLVLGLTAVSVGWYALCAWQVHRDPDVANTALVLFVLVQPTCALVAALALLLAPSSYPTPSAGHPNHRAAGVGASTTASSSSSSSSSSKHNNNNKHALLLRQLAAFCARVIRIHVLVQALVALVALASLAATSKASSAAARRRRQAQAQQAGHVGGVHVQAHAHAHAHDSDVGSLGAQLQFVVVFLAQVALPVVLVLVLQYGLAREVGRYVGDVGGVGGVGEAAGMRTQREEEEEDGGMAVEARDEGEERGESALLDGSDDGHGHGHVGGGGLNAALPAARRSLSVGTAPRAPGRYPASYEYAVVPDARARLDTASALASTSASASGATSTVGAGPGSGVGTGMGRRHAHRYHHSISMPPFQAGLGGGIENIAHAKGDGAGINDGKEEVGASNPEMAIAMATAAVAA